MKTVYAAIKDLALVFIRTASRFRIISLIEILEILTSVKFLYLLERKINPIHLLLVFFLISCSSAVEPDPPELNPPALKSPENNTEIISSVVSLEWEPVSGVHNYHLQLSQSEAFSNVPVDSIIKKNSFEIAGLNGNTSYFWRVRSINNPQISAPNAKWSDVWTFSTGEIFDFKSPALILPENLATEQHTTLELRWNEVPQTEYYHLRIASDDTFNTIIIEEETSSTSVEVSELEYETDYYWQVRAYKESIAGEWSEYWKFTTEKSLLPKTPALYAPSNGTNNQSRVFRFEWEEIDSASDYQLKVSETSDFQKIVTDKTISSNYYEQYGFYFDRDYYWQVRAINKYGKSNWTETYQFRTEPRPVSLDIWVSAYLASWNHFAPPGGNWGNMATEDIDWKAFTHLIYFAMTANEDGTLSRIADYESISPDRIKSITRAGAKSNTPVLISIGGWGNYEGFSSAIKPANRSTFVDSMVELITKWGFDGIDLDMEPIQDHDVDNYKATVKKLHSVLQKMDNPLTKKPLLTAALMGSHASLFADLQDYFDQINLMTYDYSGAWQGWVSWHNSPLFSGGHKFPGISRELPSTDGTLRTFLDAGIPAKKLGIGIDFYGYVWHGEVYKPRQSWDNPPHVEDNVPYHVIMENYYSKETYNYDSEAVAAWISLPNSDPSKRKFITYDDDKVVREKIKYVRKRGIGGAIIWDLTGGFQENNGQGHRDMLLQAIKEEL